MTVTVLPHDGGQRTGPKCVPVFLYSSGWLCATTCVSLNSQWH